MSLCNSQRIHTTSSNAISKHSCLNKLGINMPRSNEYLLFTCPNQECSFYIRANKIESSNSLYQIVIDTMKPHNANCRVEKVTPLTAAIIDAVKHSPSTECTKYYLNYINNQCGGGVTADRLRRCVEQVKQLRHEKVTNSWAKIHSFGELIISEGGDSIVEYVPNSNSIIRCAFLPYYAKIYLNSSVFFRILLADGTHNNSHSGGIVFIVITLTGNHEILPLCFGWGPTESAETVNSNEIDREEYKSKYIFQLFSR